MAGSDGDQEMAAAGGEAKNQPNRVELIAMMRQTMPSELRETQARRTQELKEIIQLGLSAANDEAKQFTEVTCAQVKEEMMEEVIKGMREVKEEVKDEVTAYHTEVLAMTVAVDSLARRLRML